MLNYRKHTTVRKIALFPIWILYWVSQVLLGFMLWPAFYKLNPFEDPASGIRVLSALVCTTITLMGTVEPYPAPKGWHEATWAPYALANVSVAFICLVLMALWRVYSPQYERKFYGNEQED